RRRGDVRGAARRQDDDPQGQGRQAAGLTRPSRERSCSRTPAAPSDRGTHPQGSNTAMTTMKKMIRAAVLGSAVLLALAGPALAQRGLDLSTPRTNSQFLYAFRDATAEATKSTVRVLCDGKEAALGTVVGGDGWILTKNSELTGKVTCKVHDGKELEA